MKGLIRFPVAAERSPCGGEQGAAHEQLREENYERNSLILISCVWMLGVASAQEVTSRGKAHPVLPFTTKLYDDFNHEFLSSALWNTSCYASYVSLECAVESQERSCFAWL